MHPTIFGECYTRRIWQPFVKKILKKAVDKRID